MEQERITNLIVISTILALVFSIAIIILFCVFYKVKRKLLIDNKTLETIIKKKLAALLDQQQS